MYIKDVDMLSVESVRCNERDFLREGVRLSLLNRIFCEHPSENHETGNPPEGWESEGQTGNPPEGWESEGQTGNPPEGWESEGQTGNPPVADSADTLQFESIILSLKS
jgi:hypothetical protein